MSRTYVTDFRHLLDAEGRPAPGLGGEFARYLGRIVESGSVMLEGKGGHIPMRCANPTQRKRCGALLAAGIPAAGTIEWECPGCGSRGLITNWEGTVFDLSALPFPEARGERCDLMAPIAELDAVRRRCDVSAALRRLLIEATGVGGDYLFLLANYEQLTALRDAAAQVADRASGQDRRLLDRFSARADAFVTTLSDFIGDDDGARELMN